MTNKLLSLDEAVNLIPDGASLGIGGILLKRKPISFLRALASSGRKGLRLHSFLASLDAELLAAKHCLSEVHAGYVGFEHLGFAPAYRAAVDTGRVTFVEYTEFLFVAGIRAAMAGLPFMPTKGGTRSEVLSDLGFVEINDPYGGEPVIAVPALRPDITVIHAEAADATGNVLAPTRPDFLSDFDANIARASHAVLVSAERIVSTDEIRSGGRSCALFSYEVDAVVELAQGAWPTALPGIYDVDMPAISSYLLAASEDVDHAAAYLEDLW